MQRGKGLSACRVFLAKYIFRSIVLCIFIECFIFIMPLTRVSYQYALGRKGHEFRKEKSCNEIGMGAEHHKLHFAHSTSGGGGGQIKSGYLTRRKEVFNLRGSLNQLKVEKKIVVPLLIVRGRDCVDGFFL